MSPAVLSSALMVVVVLLLHATMWEASANIHINLRHIDAAANLKKLELITRMVLRSNAKAKRGLGTNNSGVIPISQAEGEYLLDLAIGTPPLLFSAVLDTGSDLTWTQCKPCSQCFPQPTPLFDPSNSSTYSKINCSFKLCNFLPDHSCNGDHSCDFQYGYVTSRISGLLSSETFTLGFESHSNNKVVRVPNLVFGCGFLQSGPFGSSSAGIVGFGRGPLSLLSQLRVTKFSYCFNSIGESARSTLLFGSAADLKNGSRTNDHLIRSTSFIKNSFEPSLYYLSLNGITIGNRRLPIPKETFALKKNGRAGGFVIDSGTTFTYLTSDAYKILKRELSSQIKLPIVDGRNISLDLCFEMPSSSSSSSSTEVEMEVPKFVFHFKGADLELPRDNYMLEFDNGVMCLMILEQEYSSDYPSILGNFQQQNMRILYDLENDKLSFLPAAQCNQL